MSKKSFEVGEVVFFTAETIERVKKLQSLVSLVYQEIGRSLGVPFIVVKSFGYNYYHLACPSNPNWGEQRGIIWMGKPTNTWVILGASIQRGKNYNTISLYDLNRGL